MSFKEVASHPEAPSGLLRIKKSNLDDRYRNTVPGRAPTRSAGIDERGNFGTGPSDQLFSKCILIRRSLKSRSRRLLSARLAKVHACPYCNPPCTPGGLIQTIFSPILIYVRRLCPGPRQKRTFALLKATLDRVQALFSIRGTKRIAPFSMWMRFWRDTGFSHIQRSPSA